MTRVITEGFGAKRDELPLTGFELRASWSPVGPEGLRGPAGSSDLDTLDLSAHIAAWCDCLSVGGGPGTTGNTGLAATGARVSAGSERPRGGLADARAPAGTERPRGGLTDARAPAGTERPRGGLTDARAPAGTEAGGIVPLLEPREGLPPVVETARCWPR